MKAFATLILSLLSLVSLAQVIQNRGFETWKTDSTYCPSSYECSNAQYFERLGLTNAEKETNAFSGNYALKLHTRIIGKDTAFGYIIKGDVDNMSGGVPFTQRPDSIAGYYKCNVVSGDTALIISIFRKSGIPMGNALGHFTGVQTTYKRFSFPVTWLLSGNPDSLVFAAASSNVINEIGIADGSTLTLDSIHFVGANQTPPNHDFENWDDIKKTSPTDWGTMNDYQGIHTLEIVERLSGVDAHSGKHSIRVKNLIQGSDTLYGVVANRKVDGSSEFGGYAYTKQVDTLTGYYRFWAPQTDSATVILKFWNSSNALHIIRKLPIKSTYTAFEVPFNLPQKPDSVQITFFAGDFQNNFLYSGAYLDLDDLDFKICDLPAKPSLITGLDTFCQNIGSTSFSVTSQNDADGYSWILPIGFSITSTPLDSNYIDVKIDSNTSGSVKVEVGASVYCGVGDNSDLSIWIDSVPNDPKITLSSPPGENFLEAGIFAKKFIWTKDSDTLKSDSSKVKVGPWDGAVVKYTVIGLNGSCMSNIDTHSIVWGSVEGLSTAGDIKIYPNPTLGKIFILSDQNIKSYTLFDLKGGILIQGSAVESQQETTIDLSGYEKGIYLLRLYTDIGVLTKRITLIE